MLRTTLTLSAGTVITRKTVITRPKTITIVIDVRQGYRRAAPAPATVFVFLVVQRNFTKFPARDQSVSYAIRVYVIRLNRRTVRTLFCCWISSALITCIKIRLDNFAPLTTIRTQRVRDALTRMFTHAPQHDAASAADGHSFPYATRSLRPSAPKNFFRSRRRGRFVLRWKSHGSTVTRVRSSTASAVVYATSAELISPTREHLSGNVHRRLRTLCILSTYNKKIYIYSIFTKSHMFSRRNLFFFFILVDIVFVL